jgi:hypothetical protein
MVCIVAYATGMYLQLSKIISEIQILNFGYLLSRHYIYMSKDVRSVVIFQCQNRSTSKEGWETLVWDVKECRFPQQPHFKDTGRKICQTINYSTGITPITTEGLVTLKISKELFMQKSVSCQQIQKQHVRCAWVECKNVKKIVVKTIYSTNKTGPWSPVQCWNSKVKKCWQKYTWKSINSFTAKTWLEPTKKFWT